MSDDDWETREDFNELLKKDPVVSSTDKWEGEDEEADRRREEEEAKSGEVKVSTVAKKKKPLKQILAEKEREKREKLEAQLSPEELDKIEEARRLKELKLQEESEIQAVKEALGSSAVCDSDPITKDDFDALRKRIINDLKPFERRVPYQDFLEDLIQDLALQLPASRLRKVKVSVEAIYFEKSKSEKLATGGGSKAKKGKVKLHVEGDKAILKGNLDDDYVDEFDDFM